MAESIPGALIHSFAHSPQVRGVERQSAGGVLGGEGVRAARARVGRAALSRALGARERPRLHHGLGAPRHGQPLTLKPQTLTLDS